MDNQKPPPGPLPWRVPALPTRLYLATKTVVLKNTVGFAHTVKSLGRIISSPPYVPDLTKTYPVRPKLSIRIFFPSTYDRGSSTSSSAPLPTLFTIHGGGFCIGQSSDDDAWNRRFADAHAVLVIALDYAKAPANVFPGPLGDVQALLHAALRDGDLPVDRSRLAVAGFSAGGNLALTLARAETLRGREAAAAAGDDILFADFRAVVPVYPAADLSVPPLTVKMARRRWKVGRLGGLRGWALDFLQPAMDVFDWAYIPYGQDLRDPSLSPYFAARDDLPPHVFVVGAELDLLAYDAWALAHKLAGRPEPEGLPGREEPAPAPGLELRDERFHWTSEAGGRSVRWLLVPDALHCFDFKPVLEVIADAETLRDGHEKAAEVIAILGEWMKDTAWAAADPRPKK